MGGGYGRAGVFRLAGSSLCEGSAALKMTMGWSGWWAALLDLQNRFADYGCSLSFSKFQRQTLRRAPGFHKF
jgi:hypothetical protein